MRTAEVEFPQHSERWKYRAVRQLKNFVWWGDYVLWVLFSPYKFRPLPRSVQSVLVVEDCGIGDLLVSTPVFRALKKGYRSVTVLVQPGLEDVLRGNPHVDRVVTSVEGKYDLGVILHARTNGNGHMSRLLRRHCTFRIGCARTGFREGKGFFLHRKTVPNFVVKKKEQDNLDVIRTIGLDGDVYLEAYTDFVPPLREYVVFHTHGAYVTHDWSQENWAQLAKNIQKPLVFTGTNKKYVQEIVSRIVGKNVIDATETTIREFFGWIKHADLVVTVDTSAMHVASAFDTQVVSLFGAGDPRVWKPEPLTARSDVILSGDCHSCQRNFCVLGDHRCMVLIEPEDVLKCM